jgi:hypothetical protein
VCNHNNNKQPVTGEQLLFFSTLSVGFLLHADGQFRGSVCSAQLTLGWSSVVTVRHPTGVSGFSACVLQVAPLNTVIRISRDIIHVITSAL